MTRAMSWAVPARRCCLAACLFAAVPAGAQQGGDVEPRPFRVEGDAILAPLAAEPGNGLRGRAIVVSRQTGLCLLCHSGPFPEARAQGTLAPSLAGAGSRWSEGQLRLRVADARRIDPATMMPSYYRIDGLTRVGTVWQGKPVLTGQQVEDVVAFLSTLRD